MAQRKIGKTRVVIIATAVVTLAVTGISVLIGSASANTAPSISAEKAALSADCAKAGTPSPAVANKAADVSIMSTPPFPERSWTSTINSQQRIAPAGTAANAMISGSAHFHLPFFAYYAQLDTLASCVAWLGDSPAAPDSITHTDRWHVDYVGTQLFPVGAPAGAQIIATGGSVDVVYTTTATGTSRSDHDVAGFGIFPTTQHSYSGVFRVSHEVTAVFHFGSNSYTVTGSDRYFTG